MSFFQHPSAIVDEGAVIGDGSKIWHFSHVCSGALIGVNSVLGQGVYVASEAIVGNRCKIQNNVSIYDRVVIEDEVFCGPSVVFTNVVNPRASIERKSEYLQTLIRKGATLGANSTIICGVEVGKFAFVAAGAVLTKDAAPFSLMVGVPAKQTGWMSPHGHKINLPLVGSAEYRCPISGDVFELEGDNLVQRAEPSTL